MVGVSLLCIVMLYRVSVLVRKKPVQQVVATEPVAEPAVKRRLNGKYGKNASTGDW